MKKDYSLGGTITKDGNSENFKTGDWKNKYPYHDKEKCKNCWVRFYCSGGCSAKNYQNNHDIMLPFEVSCKMQKKKIECAIALNFFKKNM